MTASEATWAKIKQLWCETSEPLIAISQRTGVHHLVIFQRSKTAGWIRPAGFAATAPGSAARK